MGRFSEPGGTAHELEIVDISPHALRQRMKHGNIYPPDRAEQALQRFFREGNLTALRELALRKVAGAVEQDLEAYMRQHRLDASWSACDAVMVCVDHQPHSRALIRRAWRMASALRSALIAVFVETPAWGSAPPERRNALAENLRFAEDLGAEVVRVQADDAPVG